MGGRRLIVRNTSRRSLWRPCRYRYRQGGRGRRSGGGGFIDDGDVRQAAEGAGRLHQIEKTAVAVAGADGGADGGGGDIRAGTGAGASMASRVGHGTRCAGSSSSINKFRENADVLIPRFLVSVSFFSS